MKEQLIAPPKKIRLAVKLLYGVFFIALLRMVWTVITHAEVRTPDMIILIAAIKYTVFIFLLVKLQQQKNWARIGVLTILVISIPLSVIPIFQSITHSPIVNGLGIVELAIYLLALFLLFQKESSDWFRQQ